MITTCTKCIKLFETSTEDAGKPTVCSSCYKAGFRVDPFGTLRYQIKEENREHLNSREQNWLDEVAEFLEDCQDIRDGSDGQPQPNKAMILLEEGKRLGLIPLLTRAN